MTPRRAVRLLLVCVVGLPLVQAVLFWVAGLLSAMGDKAGAQILGHFNTAAGVLWLVTLVGLVIALAVQSLEEPPPSTP
jgi:hypothetical protein